MQLNATTDYALSLLLTLAGSGRVMTAQELSESTGITKNYCFEILKKMRRAGLVESQRGSVQGGYRLARKPEYIAVGEVVELFEGTRKIDRCLDEDDSVQVASAVYAFWAALQSKLQEQYETPLSKLQ